MDNFGARGLWNSPSSLVAAPPGSAQVADEVVVDQPGEYTTRHGFERLPAGIPGDWEVTAWTTYQGAIIAHAVNNTLYRYVSGTWTAFPGTYLPPTPGAAADGSPLLGRVSFFETQQTLYFTTAAGVYRLESVTGTPQLAGVVQALPGIPSVYAAGQALSVNSATAYRYVWGRRGANGRVMLGAPSDRATITNRTEAITFAPSAMVRAVSGDVNVTVAAGVASALVVGQTVTLTSNDTTNFPSGAKVITSRGTTSFHYNEAFGSPATAASPAGMSFTSAATGIAVAHSVAIPSGLDDSYFLQVYRADEVPLNTVPSDEMYIVHERAFSEMPAGATSYNFVDNTPDSLKGDSLYTNLNSGNGIGTSHYRPPKAAVSVVFQNRAFYANVEMPERISFSLISVDENSGGLRVGQGLRFTSHAGSKEEYIGDTAESFPDKFMVFTNGSPTQNVANTAKSLVNAINSRAGGFLRANYADTGNLIGTIVIESRDVAEGAISVEGIGNSNAFVPAIPATFDVDFMVRAGGTVTVGTMTPVSLSPGQKIRLISVDPTGASQFPVGEKTVVSSNNQFAFSYMEAGPDASLIQPNAAVFGTIAPDVQTDDEAAPGGWMVSDEFNPDSVPALIPEISGDRYKRILRMLPLGNSLFLLKEDGLFRITGTDPTNYIVDHVDSTVRFVAARAAFTIGTRAYALTTQGLMSWTESTRPEPASVPIESTLRQIIATAPNAVEDYAFALNHDSRRRAYLWLPSANSDVRATQVYVYNTLTDAWTRWNKPAVNALVNPADDLLYIAFPDEDGSGTAPAPAKERYTGTNTDYQDEDFQAIQALVTWNPVYATNGTQNQLVRATYRFAGGVPSSMDVAFATNFDAFPQWFTLNSSDPSQTPGTLTTPPTMQHSRGNSHTLSVRHAQRFTPLRMLGYSARMRTYTMN